MKVIIRAILSLAFAVPFVVAAQTIGLSTDDVILDVRPLIVQPNQPVSINLESYSTDINRAQVSLYENGVLAEQGIGVKEFTVAAPSVGDVTELRIVLKRPIAELLPKHEPWRHHRLIWYLKQQIHMHR